MDHGIQTTSINRTSQIKNDMVATVGLGMTGSSWRRPRLLGEAAYGRSELKEILLNVAVSESHLH